MIDDAFRVAYNRCNPDEPLDSDDKRWVDLDAVGSHRVKVRGEAWVSRLAKRFELASSPCSELFTGLRGSGKTTELRRLAKRLSDKTQTNLLVVYINAEEGIELTQPIDIPDIMISLLEETERVVLEAEGRDPNDALSDGAPKRIIDWLMRTEVTLNKIQVPSPLGKWAVELRTHPSFRAELRTRVAHRLSTFLHEIHGELEKLEARAQKLGRKGLVIIFDQLERLQGLSGNWQEVISSAERVFGGGARYLQLPVHVLYTVPPALLFRLPQDVAFLPMIKLFNRDGTEFADGLTAAKQIVLRRLDVSMLQRLFGTEWGNALDRIIRWSGGYPRDLIRALKYVFEQDELPLSSAEVDRCQMRLGEDYRRTVQRDKVEWLAEVAKIKNVVAMDDEHREVMDFMLQNNLILRYVNDQDWYDLHPALKTHPLIQSRLKELGVLG